MSIADLFNQINSYQGEIDRVVGWLQDPMSNNINTGLADIDDLARFIVNDVNNNVWFSINLLESLSWKLNVTLNDIWRRLEDIGEENNNVIDTALRNYYAHVIDLIQSAIGEVYNELTDIETFATDYVDAAIAKLDYDLSTDIIALESNMKDYVDVVKADITSDLGDMESEIHDTEQSLLDRIASKASEIYNTIGDWIDELWAGVNAAYDYVTSKLSDYHTQLMAWIDEHVTARLNSLWLDLKNLALRLADYYSELKEYVNAAKVYLEGLIDTGINELKEYVNEGIDELQDWYNYLSMLSDWRFQFLNIFMTYPELSYLQVLTRDEETFARYKPYLRALIARILKE